MKLSACVCTILLVLSTSAHAKSPVKVVRRSAEVPDYATFLKSENNAFVAITTNYFGSEIDIYRVQHNNLKLIESPAADPNIWPLGIENDGSIIEYRKIDQGSSFGCELQRRDPAGVPHLILSFQVPKDPDATWETCPENISLTDATASRRVFFVPPQYSEELMDFSTGHVYLIESDTGVEILEMYQDTIDFKNKNTGNRGKKWLNNKGDLLFGLIGENFSILYQIPYGESPEKFLLNTPFRPAGIDQDGTVLVHKGPKLFARLTTGELIPRGKFRSEEKLETLVNDYAAADTYSPVTGSSRVLIRSSKHRVIDGNCQLPNSFPWYLQEVLGKISKKHYVVKLRDSSGHLRLGIVNSRLLAKGPSYCPVTIRTRIDGGPECRSHVENRAYGEWYYHDYAVPQESVTCGFSVILTDQHGQPVKNLQVVLVYGLDGFPPIRQAVTDSRGEATFWVDLAEPSPGQLAIEAPFNHEKFRSTGAVVYYEFSGV